MPNQPHTSGSKKKARTLNHCQHGLSRKKECIITLLTTQLFFNLHHAHQNKPEDLVM